MIKFTQIKDLEESAQPPPLSLAVHPLFLPKSAMHTGCEGSLVSCPSPTKYPPKSMPSVAEATKAADDVHRNGDEAVSYRFVASSHPAP